MSDGAERNFADVALRLLAGPPAGTDEGNAMSLYLDLATDMARGQAAAVDPMPAIAERVERAATDELA